MTTAEATQAAAQAMLGVVAPKPGPSFYQQSRGQVSAWGNTTRNEGYGIRNPYLAPLLKNAFTGTSAWYRKIREMRKHPTVKLARALSVSVMADSAWSVEAEDDAPEGAKEFIEQEMMPWHDTLMDMSIRGTFDFGWQPWEKVFRFIPETMRFGIGKFKPLLQDQTEVVIKTDTGAYAGLKQFMLYLGVPNTLLITQDVEGTDFYGEGQMPSIEIAFNRWLVSDDSNVRFDKKISGSHWVIHYPTGTNPYNGRIMDNHDIAKGLLSALEGSGSIVLPNDIKKFVSELNGQSQNTEWQIELLTSDSTAQSGFSTRMTYLDALLVRACEFPERAILEGQYGTKAEAEAHADFAVARMDWRNKQIVNQINWHAVNQLLALNFGHKAANTVKLKISPIADDKITMLKTVYQAALASPTMSTAEFQNIDFQAIRDQIGIPTVEHAQGMGQGGPDYTQGTGLNGGTDPMLQQFLAHLNTPDNDNPQIAAAGNQSTLAASRA